jgi:hypothetical protein
MVKGGRLVFEGRRGDADRLKFGGKMAPADHQLVERQPRRADRLNARVWVRERPRNYATKSRTVLTGSW